jgi:hypothetical protein
MGGKYMFFGGACALVGLSILKLLTVDAASLHEVIMNLYVGFLGFLTLAINLNMQKVQDQFRFMNYYWGKAIFCLFLASMAFSSKVDTFIQYCVAIYFSIAATFFVYLSVIDRVHDKMQYIRDIKTY